jgi:hypothetical protein
MPVVRNKKSIICVFTVLCLNLNKILMASDAAESRSCHT